MVSALTLPAVETKKLCVHKDGSSQLLLIRTQQEGGEYTGSYEENISSLTNGSVGQVYQGPAA
jgi:hypothetical protein